jgi:general secretion pathway protein A
MSERHREALAHLRYGLSSSGGFVVLSGEIGAGKTTVCRCLLEQIPKHCNVAYLFNPKLTVRELLQTVCADFGIPNPRAEPFTASIKDYIDALNDYLLKAHAAGEHCVLIIDEAQSLPAATLEQLRLLTNLETNERKLLQIVLIGQPELRDLLARPELEQLAQRVVARFHLGTLSRAETSQYIAHRLAVAGMTSRMPFDSQARQRIHKLTGGVPRRINLLCDRALLGAYSAGTRNIRRPIIDKAAREVFDGQGLKPFWSTWRRPLWALGLTACAATAAGLVLVWKGWPAGPMNSDAVAAAAASAPTIQAASGAAEPTLAGAVVPIPIAAKSSLDAATQDDSAAAAAPWLNAVELVQALPTATRDEAQAWRGLATAWKLAPLAGDPCLAAREQQVYCYKRRGTVALLRQLDRPAILPLYGANGQARFVQLIGLSELGARLQLGDRVVRVAPDALSSVWRGELGTYWRVPPGYRPDAAQANGPVDPQWLATQLSAVGGGAAIANSPAAVRSALIEFQRAQHLEADGVAGPTTLMMLSRAIGLDEPRLQP